MSPSDVDWNRFSQAQGKALAAAKLLIMADLDYLHRVASACVVSPGVSKTALNEAEFTRQFAVLAQLFRTDMTQLKVDAARAFPNVHADNMP